MSVEQLIKPVETQIGKDPDLAMGVLIGRNKLTIQESQKFQEEGCVQISNFVWRNQEESCENISNSFPNLEDLVLLS